MNFGTAIELLRQGRRVARLGWNGKGMFLQLQRGTVSTKILRELLTGNDDKDAVLDGITVNDAHFAMGGHDSQAVLPVITMHTASGSKLQGWLASQTDILAEDWRELAEVTVDETLPPESLPVDSGAAVFVCVGPPCIGAGPCHLCVRIAGERGTENWDYANA